MDEISWNYKILWEWEWNYVDIIVGLVGRGSTTESKTLFSLYQKAQNSYFEVIYV